MITKENYFSRENNQKYMSASQVKAFIECEAKALAIMNGEFEEKETTSLMIGSFIDAHFSKELDIFKAKNPQIFTAKGELKAEYRRAEYIIERIERDSMIMKYISGESQVIKIGEIDGIPFKTKIDSYHPGKYIVDLKIVKDFEPVWKKDEGRINFIEAWGYDIQGAIYQEIEGNRLPFFIAGATKEIEPDIEIFAIPQDRLNVALDIVKDKIHRIKDIKSGLVEPERCGRCDYCKRTKILDRIVSMEELIYE